MIQTGKNALLRNPKTSGDHCKIQIRIRLQNLAEQGADQRDHLRIIPILIRLIQRHVILINQHDHRHRIMSVKQPRQDLQTAV